MTNSERIPCQITIGYYKFIALLQKQLGFFYSQGMDLDHKELKNGVDIALIRTGYCFSKVNNKYYRQAGIPRLDPYHTGQYSIFLYYLSNTLYSLNANNGGGIAPKVYSLNKMLHCIDVFYEVNLPDIFYLDHPIGSVIGRASFSDYFQFRQNCTVGNNHGKFPRFGKNVQLWSNVSVIGDCNVGDNVIFSSNTFVKDQDIPSNSLVFGKSPDIIIKEQATLKRTFKTHFLIE